MANQARSALRWMVAQAKRVFPERGTGWRYGIFRRRLPVPVNDNTALTISTVWACVGFVCGSISQLPWTVRQKRANGSGSDVRTDHPAYWLLDNRPNPEMSAATFRELALLWCQIFGNFYAEIEWDRAGRPINLWPIHPRRVIPDRRQDGTGELYYRVANVGGEIEIDRRDMFHVPGMSFDGIIGIPVIEYAARSLGVAIAAEEYGAGFFANSGIPSGIIQHPKTISDPAQKRLMERIKQNAGVYGSQDTLVLEEGMEFKALGLPPEQAQFLETRRFSVEDVCRWFHVPPSKVGHFEKISYNSAEQLSLDVVAETLMPWVKKFEQEANFKLLSDNWMGLYSKIDLRGQMRTTHVDRANYYKTMLSAGVFAINDVLELEDMNAINHGDLHLVPLNMAPLDDVATGKYEPGNKSVPGDKTQTPAVAEPNPPQPPKTKIEDEKRARRLLLFLDTTLDELQEYETRTGKPTASNGATDAGKFLN
jgi:HK97 family phage portal protein